MTNIDTTALTFLPSTQPVTVYTAATWGAGFVARPDMQVIERTWAAAPAVSSAALEYRYGSVMLPGAKTFAPYSKITARGYFVLIAQAADDGGPGLYWLGYAESPSADERVLSHSGDPASGVQTIPCLGMEMLLEYGTINSTVHLDPDDDTLWKRKYLGGTFNRQLKGNRFTTKIEVTASGPTAHVFQNPFPTARDWWSSRDIIEHLYYFHLPTGSGVAGTIPWTIPSAAMVPNWDRPEIATNGRSVASVLNELLGPDRMLGWKIEPIVSGGSPPAVTAVQIVPYTRAASAITLPSVGTLPVNADVSTFGSVGDPMTDTAIDVDSSESVDQVVVQGPREIGVCTIRPISEFNYGWTSAEESEYEAASSGDAGWAALKKFKQQEYNYVFRSQDKYRDVFSYFIIRPDWNGLSDDIDNVFLPDGIDDYIPFLENVEVMEHLPMFSGVDYSGDPEAVDETRGRRLIPMQTFVEKPDDATFYMRLATATTRPVGWTRYQKANSIQFDIDVVPDNIRGPGFRMNVSGAPQHAIVGSLFTGNSADEPQSIYGGIDHRKMLITCALLGDRRPFHALPASVSSDVVRRKVITLEHPGLQHVHIASATVVNIDRDGDPLYSDGGVLRDPALILQALATLAYNQYVLPRYRVRIETGRILGRVRVGSLLSIVNGETVNSVIREIKIRTDVTEVDSPPSQSMTIDASTNQVDLVDLVGRIPDPEIAI